MYETLSVPLNKIGHCSLCALYFLVDCIFEVVFKDGSQLKDEGFRLILVDKETGANYLCWKAGFGAGITPLLDSEGKIVITK